MKKTIELIKELNEIANEKKTLKQLIVENLEKNGFKRTSHKMWTYKINQGPQTIFSVTVDLSNNGREVSVVFGIRKIKRRYKIRANSIEEFDDQLSLLMKEAKDML